MGTHDVKRFDAKTSVKGQTTIPAEVRELLGLQPGGAVQFIADENGIVRIVAKKRGLRHLIGIFEPGERPLDIDEAVAETIARRTDPARTDADP
jgi:AbrB family looped-hinge helix DNA binding protein